jgi:hypothetical protein
MREEIMKGNPYKKHSKLFVDMEGGRSFRHVWML